MVDPFLPSLVAMVATKIWDYTAKPIGRHLGYVYYYHKNMDNFNTKIRDLKEQRQRLQNKVDEAIGKGEKIEHGVQEWSSRADSLIISDEVANLPANEAEALAKARSCGGYFPNPAFRYRTSKRAKKAAKKISIEIEHKFDSVSCQASLSYHIANQGYEGFGSRLLVLEEIMDALRDRDVGMVGMYGMGGVGKTMLAKEVARKGKEENLFSEVILVTVSQTPDLERIQLEFSKELGLQVVDETQSMRARRVSEKLSQKKDILIILDDVWKEIKLCDLGVQFTEDQNGCKILLTSRFKDLKNFMEIKKNFEVKELLEDEAKRLFCKSLGDFELLVDEVVKECAGLPVAITTVACALKGKELAIWKNALNELRNSAPVNIYGMSEKVYSCIRLSYNFLESEEAKSLLLLCSMYKEDAKISLEHLVMLCMGWGLFEHVRTVEGSRFKVHSVVDKLKAHCLLGGDSEYSVVMHDVIRDVAISIGSRERHMFNFASVDELEDCLDEAKLKNSTAISLMDDRFSRFPEKLACSNLLVFKLQSDRTCFPTIPDYFFKGATSLRVLDLPTICLSPPPSSFSLLNDLHTLCLKSCTIGSTSFIGGLKKLKILDLSKSTFDSLSKEVGQLTRLQLLNLEGCKDLKSIEPNVISSLVKLEELFMGNVLIGWKSEARNAILVELNNLPKLNTLQIGIEDGNLPEQEWFTKSLTRYEIYIGQRPNYPYSRDVSKALRIETYRKSQIDDGLKKLMRRSLVLHLDEPKCVKNIISELDEDGFPQLKHFELRYNFLIAYIVSSTEHTTIPAFQNLEVLNLFELKNLESLCHGVLIEDSFSKLKEVSVTSCERLKNLFPFSLSVVEQLEEITVKICEAVEEIILCKGSELISKYEFKKLRSLTLENLPKFVHFVSFESDKNRDSRAQDRPLVLFNEKVTLPCLKELKVSKCHSLKSLLYLSTAGSLLRLESLVITYCAAIENVIVMKKELTSSSIEVQDLDLDSVSFPKLKYLELCHLTSLTSIGNAGLPGNLQPSIGFGNLQELKVDQCNSLPNLLTHSTASSLAQLKKLRIWNCDAMEIVVMTKPIQDQEESRTSRVILSFPKLEFLWLSDLPNLKMFCEGDRIECPSLLRLEIQNCQSLKTFIADPQHTAPALIEAAQQPVFAEKVAFSSLQELNLNDDSEHDIWNNQFSTLSLAKLRVIKFWRWSRSNSSFNPFDITVYKNVEMIDLCGIQVENIWQHRESEIGGDHLTTPMRLRELRLKRLPTLTKLFEDPKLRCQSQTSLVASYVSLSKLSVLEVSECHKIVTLFSPSTAESLVRLKKMIIWDCAEMSGVVSEGGEAEIIIFGQLETLALHRLPRLKSFHCSDTINVHFPLLRRVILSECPEMKIFSGGVTIAPKLNSVTWKLELEHKRQSPVDEGVEEVENIQGNDFNAITRKIYETVSKTKGKQKDLDEPYLVAHRVQSTSAGDIASSSK